MIGVIGHTLEDLQQLLNVQVNVAGLILYNIHVAGRSHCESNPCMNGRCVGHEGGYICHCFGGYYGSICERERE